MRFLPKSGDIPKKLIQDVHNGRAIFLSGAGVSMRSKLPDFRSLTRRVYRSRGERLDFDPAEKIAYKRGEFDRVFGLLELRASDSHPDLEIRKLVAKKLKFRTSMDITGHKSLLKLSRDKNGEVRILTTNFDTIFEHAADELEFEYESHAFNAIPKAGGPNDFGIIHIHGRIADPIVNVEESELVLSSPDFGDAYLRNGWLSRYFEDRMRIGPIVLVGYSAEDSALRLLFESINADRARFPDLKDIYVLDVIKEHTYSSWKLKGVKMIGFESFDSLYDTLFEWAEFNINPRKYALSKIV